MGPTNLKFCVSAFSTDPLVFSVFKVSQIILSPKPVTNMQEAEEVIERLIKYDNGDIRVSSKSPHVHHEIGCCPGGVVETRRNLYAAYLDCNLLLNKVRSRFYFGTCPGVFPGTLRPVLRSTPVWVVLRSSDFIQDMWREASSLELGGLLAVC